MNLAGLPDLLLSWVKNQGALLLQGNKPQAATFQAGQQYEGKVVDNLANGRHLVKVANQMLDMNLPAKTQPGDSVRLTFLNAGPRPTFLLNQAAISPVQKVQISNTAQQVNSLLRLAPSPIAGAPTAAGGAKTSASASLVGSARMAPSTAATPGSASPATLPATRLTTLAATQAGLTRLAEAVPQAGKAGTQANLSAVAGSAASVRPIAANVLMLQSFTAAIQPMTTSLTGPNSGLLGQAVDAPRAAVASSTTLAANTLVELPSPSRHMLPVRLSQTLAESGLFYESHLAKWVRGGLSLERIQREPLARLAQDGQIAARLAELGGMPEEAARMAGRQLQMLEGAPFWWQGQAWPGQTMDWQVREGPDGDARDDTGDAAAEWITELNLTLPSLGSVHARLELAGEQLRLRLIAEDPATRDTLGAGLPLLVKGFEANGLRAVDLQVEAPAMPAADGPG